MPTVIELREKRAQLWERMKQINDAAEGEGRNLSAEEQTNWGKAETDISDLDQRIDRQEKLERTPAPNQRQATAALTGDLRAQPEYAKAFGNWLRAPRAIDLDGESRGWLSRGFQMTEERAMGTTSGAAGGYLVPEGFQAKIEQALLAFGGMRSVATILSTATGADIPMPVSDDTTNSGEILAENAAASEQDVTVGQKTLKAYMYSSKIVKASFQFLQDSAVDVESWLAGLLAVRIARATNAHFTTGVGMNQPSGIALDATSGVAGATGQTATVTWDNLVDLEQSVGSAYRKNAKYMLADTSVGVIRKLKDGEGRYLWQPGMPAGGIPNTINGFAYVINDDVAAMAASARSIFFGDLSKYIIRDVKGFMLMRLEERYAEYLQVGFLGFSRHDGMLLDAGTNPVKFYSNSAS